VRLFTLAAVVLAAAGAGSAAAAGGRFPSGSFTASLSKQSPAFLNGGWKLTFEPGGAYTTAHPPGEVVARGKLAVSGGTVAFGKETGALGCATAGRYRWTYAGGSLRFAKVSDACGGRAIVLTARPFRRAG
jgi:hypothetical protein